MWKAAEGVYRYGNPAYGYYSVFVVTEEGVIVVEPMNPQHAQGLVKAVRTVTDKPIRYLLHSHNHWDHSKGGKVFRDLWATIVAHAKAVAWMKANPHPDLLIPDEVWTGTRKDIVLGGTTIELHHTDLSHRLGMTVFRLPKEKVAFIADIVTPNRMLFSIADFNIKEWTRTLGVIEAMDFTTAIYSHSHAAEPFGSKAEVTQTRTFIQDLQTAIVAEFKKDTSFYAVPNAVKLPKYEHWDLYDQWLPLNVWVAMLQMEMGPFPWAPEAE